MNNIIPVGYVEHSILIIRGQRVMVDSDLALLYGVEAKRINEAVKRNMKRFPSDFMFQLTREESEMLRSRSQIATLNSGKNLRSQFVTSSKVGNLKSQIAISRRGENIKYLPYVFTEFGVAMLSSVLRSERAILVNVEIMRTFGRLRQILASHKDLAEKLQALENKYDKRFKVVFEAINHLIKQPEEPPKAPMGFRP